MIDLAMPWIGVEEMLFLEKHSNFTFLLRN